MNMKNTFGIFALFVVSLLLITTSVSAYKGDYTTQGPYFSEERHEAMESAMDELDYAKWYDIMSENGRSSRVLELVTAENFNTFVEAHNAGLSGDYETASELRAELGLNNGIGSRDGNGYKQGNSQGMSKNQGIHEQRFGSGLGGSGIRDGSCFN